MCKRIKLELQKELLKYTNKHKMVQNEPVKVKRIKLSPKTYEDEMTWFRIYGG